MTVTRYVVELRNLNPTHTAEIKVTATADDIAATLGQAYAEVWQYLASQDITSTGVAYARYQMRNGFFDIQAGFSTPLAVKGEGRVRPGELPGGEAAVCLHEGPYDQVGEAYTAVNEWLLREGREVQGSPWEVYLTPPGVEPLRTEVFFPLRPKANTTARRIGI